ncbi:MAG: hypothetical protein FOGNACKC_02907 [Anaerolineae bacterium]|nr:hypothetical protein [Anaerolineae bacterium]
MRADTRQWLAVAQADYDDSLYLFQGARHPNAVYHMCQALEKLLKAAQIELTGQPPQKTHKLRSLAQETGLAFSKKHAAFLEQLSKDYNRVRYPDYQRTLYNTKTKAEPIIKQGQEVFQWILTKLNNH